MNLLPFELRPSRVDYTWQGDDAIRRELLELAEVCGWVEPGLATEDTVLQERKAA